LKILTWMYQPFYEILINRRRGVTPSSLLILTLLLCGNPISAKPFPDIPKGHWAEPAVYRMADLGITGGYEDDTFRGKKSVTRYELALYLANFESATVQKLEQKIVQQQKDIDILKREIEALKQVQGLQPQ
jgi:hypothetical protein